MWKWLFRNKPDAGLAEASAAAERAERDHQYVVQRRGMIERLTADLREKREVNHFAERIRRAYVGEV